MPPQRPRPKTADAIKPQWLAYALAKLEEEAKRSLYILITLIMLRFKLDKPPSRSSLHRAIQAEPRYKSLRRRARGESRTRTRFQAQRPHQIWHADAKAKFTVRLADGSRQEFRILSIIDDATRCVLAARIVKSESTAAAVATFRQAAARWGLPDAFYADRGSCYDSAVFRRGLALLGVRRIGTRPKNPAAHGKIEVYHRSLERWFVVELKHQAVRDAEHLQALLDAVIHTLYNTHCHRELKCSPKTALADQRSSRIASIERLKDAFLDPRKYIPCPRTRNIRVHGTLYRLPASMRHRKKVEVLVDLEKTAAPAVRLENQRLVYLEPAIRRTPDPKRHSPKADDPVGSLTPLLERYRGRALPKAHPGFGLPEIYDAFARVLQRSVPTDEKEAYAIIQFVRKGPFDPDAFQAAIKTTLAKLGPGRPLSLILENLARRVAPPQKKEKRS